MDETLLKTLLDRIAVLEARIEALEASDESCTECHAEVCDRLHALEARDPV